MAVNSKDIEILWKQYSEDGVNKGISVAQFFESNGVRSGISARILDIMEREQYQNQIKDLLQAVDQKPASLIDLTYG